ncbi:MAG: tRNA glutamyl-Q(34) synthetase GluQRS [Gammaproteobacteria bacterium]|nr:MAG: tRNA glutamyl-Q(34) synthetase GluQRS [Gammaproteobacteria bacterium]
MSATVAGRRYRGRFAPSPTGPLHFGSLVSATASYLQARRHRGEWLLRIEDLDPPREPPGAAAAILQTLERHGFEPNGEILYQSRRQAAYAAALDELSRGGQLYACRCSRRAIQASARRGPAGPVYPGTCRSTPPPSPGERVALRARLPAGRYGFADRLQGAYTLAAGRDFGDPVLRRRDGLIAYALAVVVDDAWQGITEVVRGTDLLALTPGQICLQKLLGLPTPAYLHHPIALNDSGQKLSKQAGAARVDDRWPGANLAAALRFLRLPVPAGLARWPLASIWAWAEAHWEPERLTGLRAARWQPSTGYLR